MTNLISKGFDTYQSNVVAAKASLIKSAGFSFAGLYVFESSDFKQMLTRGVAEDLTDAGLYVVTLYENGQPICLEYFSEAKGVYDGRIAAEKALQAGQPAGTPIYATIDYDPAESELAAITAYFEAFREQVKQDGYLTGAYGSGLALAHLKKAGLIEKCWLSQSRGFQNYHDFLPHADIVQGPTETLFGMDVDSDTSAGNGGGWKL